MSIFTDNAQRHWDARLPVLPLQGKAAKVPGWTTLCSQMPSEEQRQAWMTGSFGTNMGLPLGQQSGVVGIDIDTDDPRVHDMIKKLLPPSTWKRVGKKGCVYAYKFTDERTFRIKDVDGNTILECLSQGAQIVLPPSIHPDTGRPYVANCELIDAKAAGLPPLPPSVEILLRGALIDLGFELSTQGFTKITSWVPMGSRDSAMTAFAGLQSRAVVRGEMTLADGLAQMEAWVINYVEKVPGDEIDVQKARDKVVQFFVRDCTGPKRRPVAVGWDVDLDPKLKEEVKGLLGEDGEAWNYEKFMTYATQQFDTHALGSGGYMAAINTLISKMVAHSSMSLIEETMFCNFVAGCSNKTLTSTALRRQLADLRKGDLEGIDHTEIAQALIPELERYGPVRFCNGSWWRYDGAKWGRMEEEVVLRQIAGTFGSYPAARRRNDHMGIMKVAASLVMSPLCTKVVDGINFANGFLTTDLVLVPHDPEFGKSYVLPYRYMPELAGQMPRMMQFLYDCWGHEEDFDDKVKALQEAIAATMFGIATQFQKAFCLFGVSGSGKTTTIDIVKALIPDEGRCSVRPAQWDDKFSPAAMEGKLMNFAGELSGDRYIAGDVFKMIVEGSQIEAQRKFQQPFTLMPRCAHWFGSNHIPKTLDTSAGFTRRWQFFSFSKPVDPQLKNTTLANEIVSEEREAIAAWAAEALPGLLEQSDYTLPASHISVVKDMGVQNNTVLAFLTNCSRVKTGRTGEGWSTTPQLILYDAYHAFCAGTANVRAVSFRSFGLMLRDLQVDFDFKEILVSNDGDGMDSHYEGISLRAPSRTSSRVVPR